MSHIRLVLFFGTLFQYLSSKYVEERVKIVFKPIMYRREKFLFSPFARKRWIRLTLHRARSSKSSLRLINTKLVDLYSAGNERLMHGCLWWNWIFLVKFDSPSLKLRIKFWKIPEKNFNVFFHLQRAVIKANTENFKVEFFQCRRGSTFLFITLKYPYYLRKNFR